MRFGEKLMRFSWESLTIFIFSWESHEILMSTHENFCKGCAQFEIPKTKNHEEQKHSRWSSYLCFCQFHGYHHRPKIDGMISISVNWQINTNLKTTSEEVSLPEFIDLSFRHSQANPWRTDILRKHSVQWTLMIFLDIGDKLSLPWRHVELFCRTSLVQQQQFPEEKTERDTKTGDNVRKGATVRVKRKQEK